MTQSDSLIPKSSDDESITLIEIYRSLIRRKNLLIFSFLILFTGAIAYTINQRVRFPLYRGNFAILVSDPIGGDNNTKVSKANEFASLAKNDTQVDIATLKVFLKSPVVIQQLEEEFRIPVSQILQMIDISAKVENGKPINILDVTINLTNKQLGEKLIKRLSEIYLNTALDMKQKRLVEGLNFLSIQAPSLQAKTDDIQTELKIFREKNDLLEPLMESENLKNSIDELEKSKTIIQTRLSRLKKIKSEIEKGNIPATGLIEQIIKPDIDIIDGIGPKLGTSLTNPQTFKDQDKVNNRFEITSLENELAVAKTKYTPNSKLIKDRENRLNKLKILLIKTQIDDVNLAITLTTAKHKTIISQLEKLKSKFKERPNLIKEYNVIQQKLVIVRENLKALNDAKEKFQLEIAQKTVPWVIISPPVMTQKAIGPNVQKYILYGAFLSLVFSSILAYLRDKLDNVYHSQDEVIKDLDLVNLGSIPHVDFFKGVREDKRFILDFLDDKELTNNKNENEVKKANYQRFFYQEAFRNLITSIGFLESDKKIKTLSLTSSLPSEGKSLINVLLAKTYSELDKKVLLIDADMRKPQLHTRLGLNNLVGLSNILTDKSLELKNVIQSVKGFDNWEVITAGLKPPDPTRILGSDRMNTIIENLVSLKKYDIILFDTPPVLGLADSALIAKKTDGMILLVSLDKVPKSLPKEAMNRIESSGAKLLGVVTNAIIPQKKLLFTYGGYSETEYGVSAVYNNYLDEEDNESSNIEKEDQSLKAKFQKKLSKFLDWIDK